MTTTLFHAPTKNFATRDAWRRARRKFLGASDAAAIWGCSPWSSPYSVCYSKIGPYEPDESDIIQRVGHAMEPLIADLFMEATGVPVYDPGDYAVFIHPEVKCMACTPDRLTNDGTAILELKTASFSSADEWKHHIPLSYQCQLQHSMLCVGVTRAYIAVLINSTSFKHHTMILTPTFARKHKAKCLAFWRQYVEKGEYPPPDYSKATSQALAKQWMDSRDRTVELPDDFAGLGQRFDKLQKVAGSVERHLDGIKNRVKAQMQDAEFARLPDEEGGWSWKGSDGKRIFKRKAKIYDN